LTKNIKRHIVFILTAKFYDKNKLARCFLKENLRNEGDFISLKREGKE